jgi:hypothetical protein
VPRLIAHDAGNGDGQQILIPCRQHHQPDILASHLHRLGIQSGVLVVHHFDRAGIPGAAGGNRLQVAILLPLNPAWHRQGNRQAIGGGQKLFDDIARIGTRIALRNVERQAVLKHAARVQQADGPVAQRIRVELAGRESIRVPPQAARGKVDGFLEVTVLRLKMLRRQIHSFRPHYSRQQLHAASPGTRGV